MDTFRSAPSGKVIFIADPRQSAAGRRESLRNAVALSRWLQTPLKLVLPAWSDWPDERVFAPVRDVDPFRIEVLLITGKERSFGPSLIDEVECEREALVVLGGSRPGKGRADPEDWRPRLMERATGPILFLPSGSLSPERPFSSILVPMTGEFRFNAALEWAIRCGYRQNIPVDVLHVTEAEGSCLCDTSVIGHLSDQFHHEYPGLMDQFISQGSPYSSVREKAVIRSLLHCTGDPLESIVTRTPRGWSGLLVLEWKGNLERGRALMIKRLLRRGGISLLLVKHPLQSRTRLRIGRSFMAA